VTARRVLVVDDEPQIRRALRVALRTNGYEVDEATTGEEGLDALAARPPDLLILDLALPDCDGVDVCRRLREWSTLPVIVLSAYGDDDAKVRALDEGADDYLTKPFSVPELLARMRVALRHADALDSPEQVVRTGDIEIDLGRRRVTRAGAEVHVTPTEYGILRHLAQHAGRVVTYGQLARGVLGPGYDESSANLRVHMVSLRRKLEAEPSAPVVLMTEPGIGYRLRDD
jgi:two-component system KDP operon response regulator KdpE